MERVHELLDRAAAVGWAMEPVAKEILQRMGLPVTRFTWARTRDEALAGAADVGFPLVVKVVSPEVVHKSDVGGVVVGVEDADGLAGAWERMSSLPAFEGVLLDQMVEATAELIVGSQQDPAFGTVVLVGIGGTAVEIYQDVSIRLAPLDHAQALDALRSLRGSALLTGHRGSEPVDLDALASLVVRFSEAAHALGKRVESIDLNPVLAWPGGAVVADARLMLDREGQG